MSKIIDIFKFKKPKPVKMEEAVARAIDPKSWKVWDKMTEQEKMRSPWLKQELVDTYEQAREMIEIINNAGMEIIPKEMISKELKAAIAAYEKAKEMGE